MKLGKELLQFNNAPTIIAVTGWQAANIYYAFNGEVAPIKKIKVPHHKYSDKEGFFEARIRGLSADGHGDNKGVMHSGAPIEKNKQHIRDDFLNELFDSLEIIINKFSIENIYFFSPEEGLRNLENSLPIKIRERLKSIYSGNYIHHKPDELIKVLTDKKPKPAELISEEAKKIEDSEAYQ